MEITQFVADLISIQGFKEWNDMYIHDEVGEIISSFLSSYLKSYKCSSKDKVQFLEEWANEIEIRIKALEDQNLPQIFPFWDLSFEVSFQRNQKVILLPLGFENVKYYDLIMSLTIYS